MASTVFLRSLRRSQSINAFKLITGNAMNSAIPSFTGLNRSSTANGFSSFGTENSSMAAFTFGGPKIMHPVLGFNPLNIKGSCRNMSANADNPQTQVLRPLSPHLPVYKPQVSSTSSIFNRISGAFLTAVLLTFYLLCIKMGPICLSFESFYQFLFYSSKLTLLTAELSALALVYHVYHSLPHIFR